MTVPERWVERAKGAPKNYDLAPSVPVPAGERILDAAGFWDAVRTTAGAAPLVALDCYPGVETGELIATARTELPGWDIVEVEDAALPIDQIDALIEPHLTDDRVFGRMSHFELAEFYDADRLATLAARLADRGIPTLVIGWGAALAAPDADLLVLADLARWEIQRRQRLGSPNWRCDNGGEDALRKYKRGYFVEWRVADRHKSALFDRVDLVLDTNRGLADATAITGDAFRGSLAATARRPFRVVPYFDPGVWGGYWMQTVVGLEPTPRNYAWCFDCVPEENSLLLEDGSGLRVELPALDLVLRQPRELLGDLTFARFGAEFPIRFDFLDTMGGGNLSLQVHPLTDYIQRTFGMPYTQDESYYLLDADDDAVVYLGLKEGIEPQRMLDALAAAQRGEAPFPAEEFVNTFPAKKHDHFPIPAGTVHCSGSNSMVLEISATPYIFTFKLWDWGRVGLDGKPRPIHLEHGARNIQWSRDTPWVEQNLVGQVEVLAEEPGHTEERTGLHELEFIETRRHWFERSIALDTLGTVNVLNLVEGTAALITSPTASFEPFEVHYAETFIVPAAAGEYAIQPAIAGERCGVVVASVRGTAVAAG
jgi:mannose-6-phosphate isomerase class I